MPRDVTRNCSNGIAYAVGDHVANDALLGQGAYRAGHRATELIPGTDRGTAIVKGFTGERSEIAQTYFIDVNQVPGIIRRSLEAIARSGRALPGTDAVRAIPAQEEARDHLADIHTALRGERRVRTQTVLIRLAELDDHYAEWSFGDLRAALAEHDLEPGKSDGVMVVRLDDIQRAITERSERDSEEDQGGNPGSGSSPYPPP